MRKVQLVLFDSDVHVVESLQESNLPLVPIVLSGKGERLPLKGISILQRACGVSRGAWGSSRAALACGERMDR